MLDDAESLPHKTEVVFMGPTVASVIQCEKLTVRNEIRVIKLSIENVSYVK